MSAMTRLRWAVLALLTLVAVAAFAIPMYVIRPFKTQDPDELAVALWVLRYGPWIAPVVALATVALIGTAWSRLHRWPRVAVATLGLLAVAGAALSHVNIYEQMFHPVGDALAYDDAAKAQVDADDLVLAVTRADQSHAYPIRTIAYHHIVNDVIAKEPIVSTY